MEQVILPNGSQRDGLIPCPQCKGKGFWVNPLAQKNDPRCWFCAGIGVIDRDHTCICGRVLRLDEKGRVVANIFCCGRKECKEKMKPPTPHVGPKTPAYSGRDDDDEAWWDDYSLRTMPVSDRRWLAQVYGGRRGWDGD